MHTLCYEGLRGVFQGLGSTLLRNVIPKSIQRNPYQLKNKTKN